ncbi:MAG: substrate-binding domain-containing protein [Spirochaetales bacterium]|nr:substrate-binding domain-containing protein [Spirochaetales bacterium]
MKQKRLHLGFLHPSLFSSFETDLWQGIHDSVKTSGCGLYCFLGGIYKGGDPLIVQRNPVYELVNREELDGLIISCGSMFQFTGENDKEEFLSRFKNIPAITLYEIYSGFSSITIDNKNSVIKLVKHFIEIHNYKNIYYITGSMESKDGFERFEAFKEAMNEYGSGFKPAHVYYGSFTSKKPLKSFYEDIINKRIQPDAIITANDAMAIYLIDCLKNNEFTIPGDIGIAGFDNQKETSFLSPPLTTIHHPAYHIGKKAVENLVSWIRTGNRPGDEIIPTYPIFRQSCGCSYISSFKQKQTPDPGENVRGGNKNDIGNVTSLKKEMTTDHVKTWIMTHLPENYYGMLNFNQLKETLLLFFSYLESGDDVTFSKGFETLFADMIKNENTIRLYTIFLKRIFIALENEKKYERSPHLELLKKTVYKLIEELPEDISRYKAGKFNESFVENYLMNDGILRAKDLDELSAFLKVRLPRFNIHTYFIFLYKNPGDIQEGAYLFLYPENDKPVNKLYDLKQIVPALLEKSTVNKSYIISGLYYDNYQIGFSILESSAHNWAFYESLSLGLSTGFKTIHLLDSLRKYSSELEKKVQERTASLEEAGKKLEIANNELKKLDNTKNEFIANITHDFRSPLTAIIGMADLGLHYHTDGEDNKINEYFRIILSASKKLKIHIDKLLDLARLEAHGVEIKESFFDYIEFLHILFNFYKPTVEPRGIQLIEKFCPTAKIVLHTDKEKVEEILHNIISNAVKFCDHKNGIITLNVTADNGYIITEIKDNGIGIPRDKINIIFNRFEQVNPHDFSNQKGTGIGLAYSRELTQLLGGEIWAHSGGIGKGTSLFLKLPLHEIDEKALSRKEMTHLKAYSPNGEKIDEINIVLSGKEEKKGILTDVIQDDKTTGDPIFSSLILIIDDDITVYRIISENLKKKGFINFIFATDGVYGAQAVTRYRPHIVICDFAMPRMSGFELYEKIMQNIEFRLLPFIFISATTDHTIINDLKDRGISYFLNKPINYENLAMLVEQGLRHYHLYLKTLGSADKDYVSGLFTRQKGMEIIREIMGQNTIPRVSVIFFTIDFLSDINNEYGYGEGDKVIRNTSQILLELPEKKNIPVRYGGNEFLVVLPGSDIEEARIVSDTIIKKVSSQFHFYTNEMNAIPVSISCSLGITSIATREKVICDKLSINALSELYVPLVHETRDFPEIIKKKQSIAVILIDEVKKACRISGQGICKDCGFTSHPSALISEGKCEKCGSRHIIHKHNQITVF